MEISFSFLFLKCGWITHEDIVKKKSLQQDILANLTRCYLIMKGNSFIAEALAALIKIVFCYY